MISYAGRIKIVEPFEVYQKYLAMKRHFTSDSYDYHKYNGKVKRINTHLILERTSTSSISYLNRSM